MLKLVLASSARKDLADIWDYTLDTWGKVQARKYYGELAHLIRDMRNERVVVSFPCQSKEYGQVRYVMYKRYHMIFYYIRDDTLEILRICHQRSDWNAAFKPIKRKK